MTPRPLRVTPTFAVALLVVATATGTWRACIDPAQLQAYGMSPLDQRAGVWWRFVTSAFVTHGAGVIWGSRLVASL